MKSTFAWISKNILLPLLPFLIGFCIRYVHKGDIASDTIDPSELAFSMAMVCILAIRGAGKLSDRPLSDSLSTLFFIAFSIFLVLFTYAAILKLEVEGSLINEVLSLKDIVKNAFTNGIGKGTPIPLSSSSTFDNSISLIKSVTCVASLVFVPLTVFIRHKYQLED